ncbi:MarR family winged helix-turn-helix transcriptional regulator [Nocardia sp. NPDC051570]|uniref:MarR family winged helix-turn-helix transcriptional regulator n=1 Tax=Nocardia sp. NPDC051570 TaxID=3364324 RepID=UPI00378FA682
MVKDESRAAPTQARPAIGRLRNLPSWLLYQAARRADQRVLQALSKAGSSRYHYSVLAALGEFGPTSQADLGRRCDIDRSDVFAVVNELVERRWVERTQDPVDRRRNIVTITPAGLRQSLQLDRTLEEMQDVLLEPLAEREREQLVQLLTRVLDHNS